MKVFSISDLHLSTTSNKPMNIFGPVWEGHFEQICEDWKEKVGNDDIVLIAGDISWAMKLEDAEKDLLLISNLSGKKVIIRGNHDYWWKSLQAIRSVLPSDVFVVQNDCVKIGHYIICGTRGWAVSEDGVYSEEDKKIYDRELIRLELSLQSAVKVRNENDKLICMIHFPPFNSKREESGFTKLIEKYGVDKVVYGHLHGKHVKADKIVILNNVEYILTSCDQVENKLVEIY